MSPWEGCRTALHSALVLNDVATRPYDVFITLLSVQLPAQTSGFVLHTRSQIVFHYDIAKTLKTVCGRGGRDDRSVFKREKKTLLHHTNTGTGSGL